jgi:hypothetical protein
VVHYLLANTIDAAHTTTRQCPKDINQHNDTTTTIVRWATYWPGNG